MKNYLGEFPVDVAKHPVYSKWIAADWAMLFIGKYGGIDGDHHKTWVLDQVARILKGTPVVVVQARWNNHEPEDRFTVASPPSKTYTQWVKEMKGPWVKTKYYEGWEYGYDEGIAP